ncbi:hypothetical protein HDV00_007747 [Rhizophlyctis rosea]|nr:hypothetical protein HDV00_007747 [Rhizophlyctis rosea]
MSQKKGPTTPAAKRTTLSKKPQSSSGSGSGKPWIFGLRLFEGKGGKEGKEGKEKDAGYEEASPRTTSKRITAAQLKTLENSSDEEEGPAQRLRRPTTPRRNSDANTVKPAPAPQSVSKRSSMSALLRTPNSRREKTPHTTQTLDRQSTSSPTRLATGSPSGSSKRPSTLTRGLLQNVRSPPPSKIPQNIRRRDSLSPVREDCINDEPPQNAPLSPENDVQTHMTLTNKTNLLSDADSLSSPEIPSSPLASESELQFIPEYDSPTLATEQQQSNDQVVNEEDMDKLAFEEYLQRQRQVKPLVARTPPPQSQPPSRDESNTSAENFPVEHRRPESSLEEPTPSPITESRASPQDVSFYSRDSEAYRDGTPDLKHDLQPLATASNARESVALPSSARPKSPLIHETPHPTGRYDVATLTARWESSIPDHRNHQLPMLVQHQHLATHPRAPSDDSLHAEINELRDELRQTMHAWSHARDDAEQSRSALQDAREEVHRIRMDMVLARKQVDDLLGEREELEREVDRYKRKIGELEGWVEEARRLQRESEERCRALEERVRNGDENLAEMRERLEAMDFEYREARAIEADVRKKEQGYHEELLSLNDALEQARLENEQLEDLLREEKAKNTRNEADFRLFSKKIRTLQDTNAELRQEADGLRTDLRKYQYESASGGMAGSGVSGRGGAGGDGASFYKDRLEQALYENEQMKAIIEQYKLSLPDTLPPSSSSSSSFSSATKYSRPYPPHPPTAMSNATTGRTLSHQRSTPTLNVNTRSSDASTFGRPQAWPSNANNTSDAASRNSLTPSERAAFQDKMRRYEEEDEGSTTSPTDVVGAGGKWGTQSLGRRTGRGGLVGVGSGEGQNGIGNGAGVKESNGAPLTADQYMSLKSELDGELSRLLDVKSKLTSEMSRIPASGGLGRVRRRKEELDGQLDDVERQLGAVRKRMKELGMF